MNAEKPARRGPAKLVLEAKREPAVKQARPELAVKRVRAGCRV